MAGPYHISTVISQSYVPERMQDVLQRSSENAAARFMAEFQKEAERKKDAVQRAEKGENPVISRHTPKKRAEEKNKKCRKKAESVRAEMFTPLSRIDFTV